MHLSKPTGCTTLRVNPDENRGLWGTSLLVQWLRLRTPNAGGPGGIPALGTRSHMPQLKILHAETKIKDPTCLN